MKKKTSGGMGNEAKDNKALTLKISLYCGNSLEVLKRIPDNAIDSIVTDPPYGLSQHKTKDLVECLAAWLKGEEYLPKKKGFMGKSWDAWVPSPLLWEECFRVLKPGGHILAFAGTRTQHLMALSLQLAGFEIRDLIAWVFGSGFPKSLDVSKAIDKEAGASRPVIGSRVADDIRGGSLINQDSKTHVINITAPSTDEARQWQGWGTALKPALEPITLARKPLDGTVAGNVLQYGVGGINIDGCRVGNEARDLLISVPFKESHKSKGVALKGRVDGSLGTSVKSGVTNLGRWPANLIHDGSEETVSHFPMVGKGNNGSNYSGSAARFFYCSKASKKDRDEGLTHFNVARANVHPTVKPTDLMRYLARLITPPGGICLDPFMGSGSTGKACALESFNFVGVELDEKYFEIAKHRIAFGAKGKVVKAKINGNPVDSLTVVYSSPNATKRKGFNPAKLAAAVKRVKARR